MTLLYLIFYLKWCGVTLFVHIFLICLSYVYIEMCYMLNTVQWYLHPHGDGGTVQSRVFGGLLSSRFSSRRNSWTCFKLTSFQFVQLTLFRCRYLVHALEIIVRSRWKPQTRAMERMHILWCVHSCRKTANKRTGMCPHHVSPHLCVMAWLPFTGSRFPPLWDKHATVIVYKKLCV